MNRLVNNSSKADSFRKITHCIFDMDGLLLVDFPSNLKQITPDRPQYLIFNLVNYLQKSDTEPLYTDVIQEILDKYGKTYTWEVKASVMGLQLNEVAKRLVEIFQLPITWQEYAELQRSGSKKAMADAKLLPDSEPIYEDMVRQIAKSFGKPYPMDVRMRIMGTTEPRTAQIAVTELKLPITVEEFLRQFGELGRRRLGDAKLLPGAQRLIEHLHSNKIPFCLATSSGEDMVEIKTKNYKDLFDKFHHKVCGATDPEVKEGKPSPDIFLVAASRFPDAPTAEKCLVFEDAPNGVKAARAAGMQAVMVPDSRVPDNLRTEATIVLNSLEEFQPELFGLPPFKE